MTQKKYLIYKIHRHLDSEMQPRLVGQGEYSLSNDDLQPDEPPLTRREVLGWIREEHISFASSGYYYNETIPVQKKRPRKGIERFISPMPNRGYLKGRTETTIIEKVVEVENPQQTLF